MPDFFAHCLIGMITPLTWKRRRGRDFLVAVILSTFPDIDVFFPSLHRGLLHSFVILIPLIVIIDLISKKHGYRVYQRLSLSILPLIHIIMDLSTGGIPVKILFPLVDHGYQSSWLLDSIILNLLRLSPYSYFIEAIRVDLVLLLVVLFLIITNSLTCKHIPD